MLSDISLAVLLKALNRKELRGIATTPVILRDKVNKTHMPAVTPASVPLGGRYKYGGNTFLDKFFHKISIKKYNILKAFNLKFSELDNGLMSFVALF